MRISDWSSDVCSSDLQPFFAAQDQILGLDLDDVPARVAADDLGPDHPDAAAPAILAQWNPGCSRKGGPIGVAVRVLRRPAPAYDGERTEFRARSACRQTRGERRDAQKTRPSRSEEHTSELQSLMRISYAVFCLKKKHITHIYIHNSYTLYT